GQFRSCRRFDNLLSRLGDILLSWWWSRCEVVTDGPLRDAELPCDRTVRGLELVVPVEDLAPQLPRLIAIVLGHHAALLAGAAAAPAGRSRGSWLIRIQWAAMA